MPERQLLYLIGYPGSGKSTVLRAALEGVAVRPAAYSMNGRAFPYLRYPNGIQIGGARAEFPGTDALAMNVQPAVIQFLKHSNFPFVVAEGDRLGNAKFFTAIHEDGWQLTVCWLNCSEELAAARRDERGSDQNPIWLRGRVTKVNNLGKDWVAVKWMLNAALPVEELAVQLREHQVIRGLRG